MGWIVTTTLLVGVCLAATPVQSQERDRVWVWNPRCSTANNVGLRVRLDGRLIYSTTLPLCRWERRFETGKASFAFATPRPLVWHGYRGDNDTSPAGTTLEVDFWQAGGESDSIELGYSVEAADGVHLNSLHSLSPATKTTSTMALGLILETLPEKKR